MLTLHVFSDGADGPEQLLGAVHRPDPLLGGPPLVRVHSACMTGDLLGSLKCDCGQQLEAAMDLITKDPYGILLYAIDHEGRGIGLADKIRAYALQDRGRDTVEANQELGLPVDARDYSPAVAAIQWFGVDRIRLATNNPEKIQAFESAGIAVERIPLGGFVTPQNVSYLVVKDEQLGHLDSQDAR